MIQIGFVVSSGSTNAEDSTPSNPLFGGFGQSEQPDYSTLLQQIKDGEVKSLELIRNLREVRVTYPDGRVVQIPVFADDQRILRTAEASGTPLTVKDTRGEAAMAGLVSNLALILIVIVGLSFLLRRSAQVANRAFGFARSQPRIKSQDDLSIRFDDVAGINDAKQELEEVVTFLKQPEAFIRLGARIPKGVLLVGPPGTGKTLLARAIAGEAGVPFFSISASEFVELFVVVGASRVRDMFKQAKDKPYASCSSMRSMRSVARGELASVAEMTNGNRP